MAAESTELSQQQAIFALSLRWGPLVGLRRTVDDALGGPVARDVDEEPHGHEA